MKAAVEVQIGQANRSDDSRFGTFSHTTVPTGEDVERVRSKLTLLRDSILRPVQPQTKGVVSSVFDNFEATNSGRSSRWDTWQTLPPWSVVSLGACALSEVGRFCVLYPSKERSRVACRLKF